MECEIIMFEREETIVEREEIAEREENKGFFSNLNKLTRFAFAICHIKTRPPSQISQIANAHPPTLNLRFEKIGIEREEIAEQSSVIDKSISILMYGIASKSDCGESERLDSQRSQEVIRLGDTSELIKIKKKGSNGMEPNKLIPNHPFRINYYSKQKYLNVSVNLRISRAGMAEWLTQFVDTESPFGLVGSIPTPSAAFCFKSKKRGK